MTKARLVSSLKILNGIATLASLIWIGLLGGVGLRFRTGLRSWFDHFSLPDALWLEVLFWGPVVVLWAVVLGFSTAARRRYGIKTDTPGRPPLWTRRGYWALAAFWLAWPVMIEVPGFPELFGLDADLARWLPDPVYVLIFLTPPLLLWAGIAASDRSGKSRRLGP